MKARALVTDKMVTKGEVFEVIDVVEILNNDKYDRENKEFAMIKLKKYGISKFVLIPKPEYGGDGYILGLLSHGEIEEVEDGQ